MVDVCFDGCCSLLVPDFEAWEYGPIEIGFEVNGL